MDNAHEIAAEAPDLLTTAPIVDPFEAVTVDGEAVTIIERPDLWEMVKRASWLGGRVLVLATPDHPMRFFTVTPAPKARKGSEAACARLRVRLGHAVLQEVTDRLSPILLGRVQANKKAERERRKSPAEPVEIRDFARVATDKRGRVVMAVAAWAPDSMLARGAIDKTQHAAAVRFREDWHRVGAGQGLVAVDLMKCGGGSGGGWREPDPSIFNGTAAEGRVVAALSALSADNRSLVISVVGEGQSVSWWVRKHRAETGKAVNNHTAAGMLVGALDALAVSYGINRSRVERKPIPPEQRAAERRARLNLEAPPAPIAMEREPEARLPLLTVGAVDLAEAERKANERYLQAAEPVAP